MKNHCYLCVGVVSECRIEDVRCRNVSYLHQIYELFVVEVVSLLI